ncbi:LytR/AlgR family response regulator transcription factor [Robiginitalea sp. IMCC44478]|uniref:LytR/AlgR family response regulator transcription factor n=1 Tax=Robiginitalea sp. IMCC44478 TaxID=3459122 RepID=UPI0040434213
MEYTYSIIDSSATSNLQLQHFLEEYGDFMCVSQDASVTGGLNSILKFKPDLVILNLEQQARPCFEMVRDLYQYLEEQPLVIGIAACTDYAYEALKNQFFDYWLMPFNEFDIRKTLLKLKKRFPKTTAAPTLCLQSYKDYQYLNTNDILYLKADNNTTDFIMKDGSRISAYKTLKCFEEKLPENFVRIHQSYILNQDYISRINYGKSRLSLRIVKTEIPFSRSYKPVVDILKQKLSQNSLHSGK